MKSLDRPLGRAVSDFLTPRTSASVLILTQRETFDSSPYSSGIRWCDSISTRSASGNRWRISLPRGSPAAAGST